MKEAARNRLLRRVDWRFLLPDPNPKRSLCLSEELFEPLALVSPEVFRNPQPGGDSACDLAVAIDPEPAALQHVWASLRPGGACYTEWRRPFAGGWRAVAGRLEMAGFEGVTCYWPRPDPVRRPSTVWIPLAEREPLEYYRTHRRRTRNPMRLAGRAARRVQWVLSPRRPVCAIARKPEPPGLIANGSHDELTETIQARWSRWGLGQAPRHVSRLLRAAPGRTSGKVVAFFFAPGRKSPAVAAKMARTPESAAGLRREAELLSALERRPGGVPGAPRMLLCRPEGIVVETALAGLPLRAFLRRGTFQTLAEQATGWLADLAGPDDGARRRPDALVSCLLEDFESNFGSVVEVEVLREARRILAELPPLRTVVEHRDFAPWNVLTDGQGRLAILDWESAEPEGLPALDLIYFLTYLALSLDRNVRSGRHRESLRRSLDAASLTGSVSKQCLDWYADKTGTPNGAIRSLRLLTWLVHSRSEHRHMVEDAGGPPDSERLRRSIFVDFLREELRLTAGAIA